MQKENSLEIRKILYITTQLTGTLRYFSWASFPSIWYARIQKKVLDLLLKTNSEIFIKFYPNDALFNPNKEYARKFKNMSVIKDDLVKLLKNQDFDLIITEAYATTLLEILCTKSQIILFTPKSFIRLFSEAKKILENRVFLAEDLKSYYKILEQIPSMGSKVKFKEIDDEFLIKFGIGNSKRRSECAARGYISSIIG